MFLRPRFECFARWSGISRHRPSLLSGLVRNTLVALSMAAVCGCGQDIAVPTEISEVVVSEDVIQDFFRQRGAIDAHRVGRPPPAAGLTHAGDADGVIGVLVRVPEPIFWNLGFRDGDKIIAIDQDTTESIYSDRWQGYGRYAKPSAFGTDKYTGLMADIFRRRSDADSTLVILNRITAGKRDSEAIGIRLLFAD